MTQSTVTTGLLGSSSTLELGVGGDRFRIAQLGATPLSWRVELPDGPVDVLDGYQDEGELAAQDGVRNGVMAPFCNRVADGRYTFDGRAHDLLPGASDRVIYHGLVRTREFAVLATGHGGDSAWARLRCEALAGGHEPGYPFAVVIEVTYRLRAGALTVEIVGENVGATAAPFSAGWHPYFRLPGAATIDRLHVDLAAHEAIATDAELLPRAGALAYRPLVGRPGWEPIGAAVVDGAFVGVPDETGAIRSVVHDPVTGVELAVWQDRGLVHVFTGDTVARDRRASVAIEPVEVMTDAFNRPDCAAAIRLEPGERRSFRFGVDVRAPAAVAASEA
ncbi:MAG: aldose 1-epimerase [Cellulomonas sp.]